MHFCLNFIFLSFLVISLLTGNDLSHFQPNMHYLISSNASHSIHLFLAQWRLVLSESAVYQCLNNTPYVTTVSTVNYHQTLCHELHGMFYMWCQMWQELQENCAINAPNGKSSKTAVLVILSMRSLVLHRTAEPQEALWHFGTQYGTRDCQNCKTVKTATLPKMCQNCQKCAKLKKSKNHQKQHFQG